MPSLGWALSLAVSFDMLSFDWALLAPSLLMLSLDWALSFEVSFDWALLAPSLLMPSLDCVAVVPAAPPESRFIAPPDGAGLCWVAGGLPSLAELPPAPVPAPPVPCANAKPLPAINAAAATDTIKRLVIGISPHLIALPTPTTKP